MLSSRPPGLVSFPLFVVLVAGSAVALPQRAVTDYADADRLLRAGTRAVVWYLGHSGWAVRTRGHLLVFDYWEYRARTPADRMASGFINPAEVADSRIRVFVSHGHADHYDPVVFTWKEHARDIKYVFGWTPPRISPDLAFGPERGTQTLGDMSITHVHHSFDGVPESAFLIDVDGLVVYHAGDHGHGEGEANPVYKANIDYLASLHEEIDLAFVPTFGGEDYAIERLAPRVAVPMHDGGREGQYAAFQRRAERRHPTVRVFAAVEPGDAFRY